MDIKTWIDSKAELCGYHSHTPKEIKEICHDLLAEIEKEVGQAAEDSKFLMRKPYKDAADELLRVVSETLHPSEPKEEEKCDVVWDTGSHCYLAKGHEGDHLSE